MAYRVKSVKNRPVDSRERLPTEKDAVGSQVFVYFGKSSGWKTVSLTVTLIWAQRYTLYWSPTSKVAT